MELREFAKCRASWLPRATVDVMTSDPEELEHRHLYKLMTSIVIPRPIALITTLGPAGPNGAPFDFFDVVAMDLSQAQGFLRLPRKAPLRKIIGSRTAITGIAP